VTTLDDREYLPAMGRPALLPLYDPFTLLLGVRDAHWRLVAQAGIEPSATVLEIGCGTGNLLLLAAHAVPGATLIGLDPDPAVLAVAGRKARRAGVALRLDRGYADRLPYPDGSVDRVLSAFMLHHLPADQQQEALREVHRVLAPGGRLHMLDIDGSPPSRAGRLLRAGHLHRAKQHDHGHEHGHGHTARPGPHAHADPDIALAALRGAGLTEAAVVAHGAMPMGGYSYYRATR
jgi:SAM-dependent methyltransferase